MPSCRAVHLVHILLADHFSPHKSDVSLHNEREACPSLNSPVLAEAFRGMTIVFVRVRQKTPMDIHTGIYHKTKAEPSRAEPNQTKPYNRSSTPRLYRIEIGISHGEWRITAPMRCAAGGDGKPWVAASVIKQWHSRLTFRGGHGP